MTFIKSQKFYLQKDFFIQNAKFFNRKYFHLYGSLLLNLDILIRVCSDFSLAVIDLFHAIKQYIVLLVIIDFYINGDHSYNRRFKLK